MKHNYQKDMNYNYQSSNIVILRSFKVFGKVFFKIYRSTDTCTVLQQSQYLEAFVLEYY